MTTLTGRLLASNELRWGGAGWSFFILENFLLSENRTYLRDVFGDDNYHLIYGFMSTIAMGSVGFSYYKLNQWKSKTQLPPRFRSVIPTGNLVAAWSLASVGLILASQALPKMQIPVTLVAPPLTSQAMDTEEAKSPTQNQEHEGKGYRIQVRCPFDFSDKHSNNGQENDTDAHVRGMDRVTRHPGLWSFGLISAGNAALQSNIALRLWWLGPAAVAWLGGMHTDSRFRRGMGGHLDPLLDSQTSNIPFLAMVSGKQGSPMGSFGELLSETKPLNASAAVIFVTMWVLSRGRIH